MILKTLVCLAVLHHRLAVCIGNFLSEMLRIFIALYRYCTVSFNVAQKSLHNTGRLQLRLKKLGLAVSAYFLLSSHAYLLQRIKGTVLSDHCSEKYVKYIHTTYACNLIFMKHDKMRILDTDST